MLSSKGKSAERPQADHSERSEESALRFAEEKQQIARCAGDSGYWKLTFLPSESK